MIPVTCPEAIDQFCDEQKTNRCPVCHSLDVYLKVRGRDVRLTTGVIGSSRTEVATGQVLRCRRCGHGFQQGPFSDEEVGSLYETMDVTCYDAEETSRRATGRRHVRLILSHKGTPRKGRLLDIGCGSGLFLEEAEKNGWSVAGVEPNRTLAEKAAARLGGGGVQRATLKSATLESCSFDVITAWDVLEHVADPTAFLAQCANLLKPGGVMWLKVPDIDSVQARVLRARWPVYLLEHLGYFSRASLALCAGNAGLRVISLTRAPVTFSVGYIFARAAQHRIVFAGAFGGFLRSTRLDKVPVSMRLGELYCCLAHTLPSSH